jgi:hypothetical protein
LSDDESLTLSIGIMIFDGVSLEMLLPAREL